MKPTPYMPALLDLPYLVEQASWALEECQYARDALQSDLHGLQAAISDGEPLPTTLECLQASLGIKVDNAEKSGDKMEKTLEDLTTVNQECSHENLVSSCEQCPEEHGEFPLLGLSGAVRVFLGGRFMGHLVGAFRSAANHTSDTLLRERYISLSQRFAGIPNSRVLNIIAPSLNPFSQSFVALPSFNLPDDGQSPLAVVLTSVRTKGTPPALNHVDRQLLSEMLEVFKSTLDRRRDCRTCEDPPR